ncbi:hypothetical protein AVEN_54158-1 [Araneus ventricosus]|uniref:Uncharacterized protein n=1 Tax=Araneus ventricosus TaxID=182803 RepID=A0A4Y2BTM3_ARAVE|nr:hypothetical protein AVEN_54158-1 [Araneus ventricosus]
MDIKLGIHEGGVPVHLLRTSPHRSNFQPIHLGNSFMEASGKPYDLSLRSPRAIALTSPPTFKTRPRPRFPEKASLPHFVVFAFVREVRSPLPTIVFQFYGPPR